MSDSDSPSNGEHPQVVELTRASSSFEARVIVAVLEQAGIPAYVPGGELMDEFAISQTLMNVQFVQVLVPADRVEAAQQALAQSKVSEGEIARQAEAAAPQAPPASLAGSSESKSGPSTASWLLLILLLVVGATIATALWREFAAG